MQETIANSPYDRRSRSWHYLQRLHQKQFDGEISLPAFDPMAHAEGGPEIIHFVGHPSPVVLNYLVPATNALAKAGFRQRVIAVAPALPPLWQQPLHHSVRVESVVHPSFMKRWRQGLATLNHHVKSHSPSGIHMHGFVPFVLGGIGLRNNGFAGDLFYSPHGSKAHREHSKLGLLAFGLVSPWIGGKSFLVIADEGGDPSSALPSTPDVFAAVPMPIADAYFELERIEAPTAVVVGGATEATEAEVAAFCQLATALPKDPAEGTAIRYVWVGPITPVTAQALKAAEVETVPPTDLRQKLAVLASAWLYVAPARTRGFASHLAEAMAAALPCLVLDVPEHRALMDDSVGAGNPPALTYDQASGALAGLLKLIADEDRRKKAGPAARRSMQRQHTGKQFEAAIVPLYT